MTISPIHNLRSFATSKPPLVVFMICMGICAVVLLTLSYYVRMVQLPSNDAKTDWNIFLQNVAEVDFCVIGNVSENGLLPEDSLSSNKAPTSRPLNVRSSTTAYINSDASFSPASFDYLRNYSVSLLVTLQPTRDFLSMHHNITHLSGQLMGSDIGLKDAAAQEIINFLVILPFDWNSTRCSDIGCDVAHIYACVYLQGSSVAFPRSRAPDHCERLNQTGIDYHVRVKPATLADSDWQVCGSKPYLKMNYHLDSKLTVFLNMHNSSVINLHLMHTSYFLFVMFITMFCYALLKTRPHRAVKASLLYEKNHASDM